jgi:hypothetical protein
MPSDPALPSREAYVKDSIPFTISSAAGPCPICQEGYDDEHRPVLFRHCSHIFGKSFILEWFEEGENTCPLDKIKLFSPPTDVGEGEG